MPYKDPKQQSAYQNAWMAARRSAWIAEHGPCVDCKTWDDLEVDHVNARTKVTHRVWSWSAERREAELAKCVVRCQSCHRKKTTAAGEHPRGERTSRALLTEVQVREIRASKLPRKILAVQYGVQPDTIKAVRQRQSWQHVA
jgi:5-methylcytosine-specific restriction endonuclease McrA